MVLRQPQAPPVGQPEREPEAFGRVGGEHHEGIGVPSGAVQPRLPDASRQRPVHQPADGGGRALQGAAVDQLRPTGAVQHGQRPGRERRIRRTGNSGDGRRRSRAGGPGPRRRGLRSAGPTRAMRHRRRAPGPRARRGSGRRGAGRGCSWSSLPASVWCRCRPRPAARSPCRPAPTRDSRRRGLRGGIQRGELLQQPGVGLPLRRPRLGPPRLPGHDRRPPYLQRGGDVLLRQTVRLPQPLPLPRWRQHPTPLDQRVDRLEQRILGSDHTPIIHHAYFFQPSSVLLQGRGVMGTPSPAVRAPK